MECFFSRLSEKLGKLGRDAAFGSGPEVLAVIGPEVAERSVAKAHSLFEHRVEHRREVAGRGVDDLQHLGGRGLLLQRFGEFSLTLGKPMSQIGYTLLGIG